jgi:hypothetical protein
MAAPSYAVVYRISRIVIGQPNPHDMVLDATLDIGYVNGETQFVKLGEMSWAAPGPVVTAYFEAPSNGALSLYDNVLGVLGTYLVDNGIVDGAVIA